MSKGQRTVQQKLQTKIRLLIAGIAHKSLLKTYQKSEPGATPWHPRMTMIPCEWSRPLGEVRTEANRRFRKGEDTVVVPVLREPAENELSIAMLFMSCNGRIDSWSEDITAMDGSVSMGDIADVMKRNKNWDIRDIQGAGGLDRLLDMA